MADEVTQVSPTPVTVSDSPTEPVVEASSSAPPTVETPEPVVEQVAAPKPVEETLLGAEPPKVESPKTEVPKESVDGAKPQPETESKEEVTQSDKPAPLPSYDEWKLPEGATPFKEGIETFNQYLGEFQTKSKADQAETQTFGQKLVDYHVERLTDALQKQQQFMVQNWENTKNAWKDAFIADPEIGGNRQDTTLEAARTFIRAHGGNDEQRGELLKLFNDTGIGNHPALIRLLAKANMAMSEGRPLAAQKPAVVQASKVARRYGNEQ